MSEEGVPPEPTGSVEVTTTTLVEDHEILFRRVICGSSGYVVSAAGDAADGQVGAAVAPGVPISASAFADRVSEPSVDRETMCLSAPPETWTQEGEDNGVLWLQTGAVRAAKQVQLDSKGKVVVQTYDVDVAHRPIAGVDGQRDNPAHSVVHTRPGCLDKGNVFRRLRESLARLAQWKILPRDARGR